MISNLKSLPIVIALIATLLLHGVSAQAPRFESLSYEDGLPGYATWSIVQDGQGYIWIGSVTGLARYDNNNIEQIVPNIDAPDLSTALIRALHIDDANRLWIGTGKRGLFVRTVNNEWKHFANDPDNINSLSSDSIYSITSDSNGAIWIGTDKGLNELDPDTSIVSRYTANDHTNESNQLPNDTVRSLERSVNGGIWIGTYDGLALLNTTSKAIRPVNLNKQGLKILDIHESTSGQLWIGHAKGLLHYDTKTQSDPYPIEKLEGLITITVHENKKGLWFGTLGEGVFHLSDEHGLTQYKNNNGQHALADNSITTIMTDRAGVMWLGTFHNGISKLTLSSLSFGRINGTGSHYSCMKGKAVTSILAESSGVVWIGMSDGVARVGRGNDSCHWYPSRIENKARLPRNPKFIIRTSNDEVYLTGSKGLGRINERTQDFNLVPGLESLPRSYFLKEIATDKYLIGTVKGLRTYEIGSSTTTLLTPETEALQTASYYAISTDSMGTLWLATSVGIASLNANGEIKLLRHEGKAVLDGEATGIIVDHKDTLWVTEDWERLLTYSTDGDLIRSYQNEPHFPGQVMNVLADLQNHIWVGTLNGLVELDQKGDVVKHFQATDGLQGRAFSHQAGDVSDNGELLFGGRLGLNRFFPHELDFNSITPTVVLSGLRILNSTAQVGQPVHGFTLEQPLEFTKNLKLKHNHKMISIELAALNVANARDTTFAYQLGGFDTNWNEISSPERTATYTNLAPGSYEFQVKAKSGNGAWSEPNKALTIHIATAPWASWWAKTLYVLVAGLLIILAIARHNANQRRYANELKNEVVVQTKEIEQQKKTIEDILARKNSLFQNISHEFKTPLTLLIGPLETLRKQLATEQHSETIGIAIRNAKRLLAMVEQLLRLAEVSHGPEIKKTNRQLAPALKILIASFAPAAKLRDITLSQSSFPDVNVSVTTDAIEIVVGNLLSNAIKYTEVGGTITVECLTDGEYAKISVIDDGDGIEKKDIDAIFDRFTRLSQHSKKSGTGLGLAVAKEVVEANGGSIFVKSTPGEGSCFSLTLPVVDEKATETDLSPDTLPEFAHNLISYDQTNKTANKDPVMQPAALAEEEQDQEKPLILAIDDHEDILNYIETVLSEEFRFVGATGGLQGIELATTLVPDLVVCDVMMPDMDGFDVSVALRNNDATSHIPIVLLTARDDRDSRLRGWEATVDDYIRKPFNEIELTTRLKNLLKIRQLLCEKRGWQIHRGGTEDATEGLSSRDASFIKNIDEILAENYTNARFDRAQLASAVNVSERQLQRKMKALINCNPSDFVRDYRLEKAAHQISAGQQIMQVAFECGFSSSSYFAKCFRAKYEMTPKQFQLNNK